MTWSDRYQWSWLKKKKKGYRHGGFDSQHVGDMSVRPMSVNMGEERPGLTSVSGLG